MIEATTWATENLTSIIYLVENKITKDCYIGQTYKTFKKRYGNTWASHINSNKSGENTKFKNALLSYGQENFAVYILCYNIINRDELDELEKYYINLFKTLSPGGYNLNAGGRSGRGTSIEANTRIGKMNSKKYVLKDYKNNIIEVNNLSQFCRDNNLGFSAMFNMVNSRSKSSFGYGLAETDLSLIENPNKTYGLVSDDGNLFLFYDVGSFCKKANLNINCIWPVLVGHDKSHKGLRRINIT